MSSPLPAGISVRDLTKHYGSVEAVGGASFDVAPGEIFGLLGLNGAGKTTVIECLLGLRQPDSGSVALGGIDARAHPALARQRVGAQLQFAALQDKITPRQALRLFGSFYPETTDADSLLNQFQLTAKSNAAFDTLSGGQKQRLFLALAVVHRPPLVVLDEPTTGLDPLSRREMHRLLRQMKSEGRAVLLSTHDLEEARQLCDRIGILHGGRIIAQAPPADLIAGSRTPPRIFFRSARRLDMAVVASLPGAAHPQPQGDGWLVATPEVNRTIGGLVQTLQKEANEMLDLQILRPSLEDVFLELTGRAWADAASETSS